MSIFHRSKSMTRVQKITLTILTAFALAAGTAAAAPGANLTGDPSQWGVARKGSFDITEVARKVNEYEGQHRG
jgi:hypothetical protein